MKTFRQGSDVSGRAPTDCHRTRHFHIDNIVCSCIFAVVISFNGIFCILQIYQVMSDDYKYSVSVTLGSLVEYASLDNLVIGFFVTADANLYVFLAT